jgi:hypothetical protein
VELDVLARRDVGEVAHFSPEEAAETRVCCEVSRPLGRPIRIMKNSGGLAFAVGSADNAAVALGVDAHQRK